MMAKPAQAAVCGPGERDITYKDIYCGMKLDDNEENDAKLTEKLAAQFEMDEEIIQGILSGTICQSAGKLSKEEQDTLPDSVRKVCIKASNSSEQLDGWNHFTDIQNAYEKEKAIQMNSASLTFKFEAAERYADGSLVNSPFDLIVDLNLIEKILFGSKAQWLNDVYAFPVEEDGDDDDEVLLDSLVPDSGDDDDGGQPPDETRDAGLTGTGGGGGSRSNPANCVTPDNPLADNGTGPSTNNENTQCGNGTLDILLAEQCDDGNKVSGDGCNQYCQKELGGSGSRDSGAQCMDPEAVNFKTPGTAGGSSGTSGSQSGTGEAGGTNAGGSDQNDCPPGTVPSIISSLTAGSGGAGSGAEGIEVPQPFEYPGPFLGGTMKQFPESNRPLCGPGESPLEVTVAGRKSIAKDNDGKPICIRLEYCSDPDDTRDLLFGSGWENDDRKIAAEAIEAVFCVNVIQNTRPLTPYAMNEGCIDCHIRSMVDSLEEALATNVTPFVNTTSAFAISSKFGPNFSFNLTTAAKTPVRYTDTRTGSHAIEDADRAKKENVQENAPRETSVTPSGNPLAELNRNAQNEEQELENILEGTRMMQLSSGVISDQELDGRIKPMLLQMDGAFSRIHSAWQGMVQSTYFDEKLQCRP